jgi:hypothetical protein
LRAAGGETRVEQLCNLLEPGVRKISAAATKLIRSEVRNEAAARRDRLLALGASEDIVRGLVRLYELDGVFGIAALAARHKIDELALTRSYTRLGEALGLDWAQQQVARFVPADQWERLLTAGLARDFEQLRIEFLSRRRGADPDASVDEWIERHSPRIQQFRELAAKATSAHPCLRRSPAKRESFSAAETLTSGECDFVLARCASRSSYLPTAMRSRGAGHTNLRLKRFAGAGPRSRQSPGPMPRIFADMIWCCPWWPGAITAIMLTG